MKINDNDGKISRISYILNSIFEYFIIVIVGGTFLTNLLNYLNVDTATQGIVASFATFATVADIVALILIRRRSKLKNMIITLLTIDELCFALLYFTPLFHIPSNIKTIILVLLLFIGNFIMCFVSPFRMNWQMSNVAHDKRGEFTAIKESITLLISFVFTIVMGRIIDYYEAKGNIEFSFIICGISCIILTFLNLIVLLLIKEHNNENENITKISLLENLKRSYKITLGNSTFRKVCVFSLLFYTTAAAGNFNGTYQRNTLGFSMTFISILALLYSVFRSVASIPLGKYADKHSWIKMIKLCSFVAFISYVINAFTVPSNGNVMYTIYYCLYAIAMGGFSSALLNIIYEYIPSENVRLVIRSWRSKWIFNYSYRIQNSFIY